MASQVRKVVKCRNIRIGQPFGGQSHGFRRKRGADKADLHHCRPGKGRDDGCPRRAAEGVAHGLARHCPLPGQIPFRHPGAGRPVQRQDLAGQLVKHRIGDQRCCGRLQPFEKRGGVQASLRWLKSYSGLSGNKSQQKSIARSRGTRGRKASGVSDPPFPWPRPRRGLWAQTGDGRFGGQCRLTALSAKCQGFASRYSADFGCEACSGVQIRVVAGTGSCHARDRDGKRADRNTQRRFFRSGRGAVCPPDPPRIFADRKWGDRVKPERACGENPGAGLAKWRVAVFGSRAWPWGDGDDPPGPRGLFGSCRHCRAWCTTLRP